MCVCVCVCSLESCGFYDGSVGGANAGEKRIRERRQRKYRQIERVCCFFLSSILLSEGKGLCFGARKGNGGSNRRCGLCGGMSSGDQDDAWGGH